MAGPPSLATGREDWQSVAMVDPNVFLHAFRAWRRIRRDRKAEPEAAFLPALVAAGDTCLHVGASDGRHSVVMARAAAGVRVHAFEPSRFTFQVLRLTLGWLGLLGQVTTVNAAVSDAPGVMNLVTPVKTSGRMGRSLAFVAAEAPIGQARPDVESRAFTTQATPVVALDDYCADHGLSRIDVIRMDIEGAEQAALKGALGLIDRDLPSVLIEIHPQILRDRFGGDAASVVALFLDRGYRMFELTEAGLEPRVAVRPDLPWKDYFFVHPARLHHLPPGVFRDLLRRTG